MTKSIVVQAIGTAVGYGSTGDQTLADRVQAAMTAAIIEALAEGVDINDSTEILRRKMDAKDRVLNTYGQRTTT